MFHTIESAIEDIKAGKMVIVVDDEDRENEGDFITAARNASPEVINFMSKHGRGLICVPMPEERCDELGLERRVLLAEHRLDVPVVRRAERHAGALALDQQADGRAILARPLLFNPLINPFSLVSPLGFEPRTP